MEVARDEKLVKASRFAEIREDFFTVCRVAICTAGSLFYGFICVGVMAFSTLRPMTRQDVIVYFLTDIEFHACIALISLIYVILFYIICPKSFFRPLVTVFGRYLAAFAFWGGTQTVTYLVLFVLKLTSF